MTNESRCIRRCSLQATGSLFVLLNDISRRANFLLKAAVSNLAGWVRVWVRVRIWVRVRVRASVAVSVRVSTVLRLG